MKRSLLCLLACCCLFSIASPARAAGIPIPNIPPQHIPTVADEQKPLLRYYYRAIGSRSSTKVCKTFNFTIQHRQLGDPMTLTSCAETVKSWRLSKSTWRSIKIVGQKSRQRSKKTATWNVTLRYKQRGNVKTFHESLSLSKLYGTWVFNKIPSSLYKATGKQRRPLKLSPYTGVTLLTGNKQADSPYRNCTDNGPGQMALDVFDDMSKTGSNPPAYFHSPLDIRWTLAAGGQKGICFYVQNNVREWKTNNTTTTVHVESENGVSADYRVIYIGYVFYTAKKINGVWSNAKPAIHILDGGSIDVINIASSALPAGFNPSKFSWSVTNYLKDPSTTGTDVYPDTGLATYDSSLGEITVNTPEDTDESYSWGDNGLSKDQTTDHLPGT